MEDGGARALLRYIATRSATSGYTRRLDGLVRRLRMTPREQLYYNNWLDICDELREEGYAEGRTESALATARRMLTWGRASLEEIADCTALSLDEVRALREETAVVFRLAVVEVRHLTDRADDGERVVKLEAQRNHVPQHL